MPFKKVCCPNIRLLPFYVFVAVLFPTVLPADEPPTIPIGYDAYLQWERWPQQRIGARTYMRSTYDRTGRNRSADASNFLYQLADDFNVTLDIQSPGILYFARYNHWHGSPWHYETDGIDHIVQESSSKDPTKPVKGSVFLPEKAFPSPLAVTWSTTKGADLSWVPIGFEKSFRMAYTRTTYGTGYYIYHNYLPGISLSQPIKTWTPEQVPPAEVVELFNKAGTDLVPTPDSTEGKRFGIEEKSGTISLTAKSAAALIELKDAPTTIRGLYFSAPKSKAIKFGRAKLRITWDDRKLSSIEAPIALFFGAGTFYNRADREYLVKGFPIHVRFSDDRIHMACFYPMPFFKSAKIELIGADEAIEDVKWTIRYTDCKEPAGNLTYFHATYQDHPTPVAGHDMVLLDTTKTEGGGDWSGSFVGTSFIFSHDANLYTLEGDPRFFFDDSKTPQAQGTGTEEWGGGGDFWGGITMTLPFAGHPVGARNLKDAKNDEDKIESAYRFLLADLMPFGRNARIQLEHGGINQSEEHYETVTYWYGAPYATLVKTDELKLANADSEREHRYVSPDSTAYEITSRYELGPDQFPLKHQETFGIQIMQGRRTTGASEFSLKLDPKNVGVMLRRTLDYSYPNQRAEVFVADDLDQNSDAGRPLDWQPAGVWYLAGSNTCVYSNNRNEVGKTIHEVITSNRRFRDDEFLLPRSLTEGRSKIRIRVKFTPAERPLFPGHPLAPLSWTEIRYDAYCYVMPKRDALPTK
jgi:hypothetical protein